MNDFDLTKTIGYSILKISRHMQGHMTDLHGDVTMAQGAVLYFLAQSSCDMIQQDIAEIMDINKSGLLRTIDILEDKGLLKRLPVENDRRKNRIELTKTGSVLVDDFVNRIKEKDKALRSGFKKEEMDSFFKVLKALEAKVYEE
jgi:DNA-binding MarR family transcriptional regulator